MPKFRDCAYCGSTVSNADREHAIPSCLYPESKSTSTVQRITVHACRACNRGWSDDEAHFRNVLILAAGATAVASELWKGPALRSFDKIDGRRRLRDLYDQMRPVNIANGGRFKIYPGNDVRVTRVVRKIVRGLSHYHGVETAIKDERVWADILKFQLPDELVKSVTFMHREPDVLEYWYEAYPDGDIRSVWYLKFFQRVVFVAAVHALPVSATG